MKIRITPRPEALNLKASETAEKEITVIPENDFEGMEGGTYMALLEAVSNDGSVTPLASSGFELRNVAIYIYFIDDTEGSWAHNDDAVIELVDNTKGHDHYVMEKVDDVTWRAKVPPSAYNITFNRLSPDMKTQWNSWSAGGRDGNNAYHAKGHEYGFWEKRR